VDNLVVAEDLREQLSAMPSTVVDVRHRFEDDWGEDYEVAFFGVSMEALLNDSRAIRLRGNGTQLVVLSGGLSASGDENNGVVVLPQPFRSEDVSNLMETFGIHSVRPI
jgi:hypothetical protein